jgi:excinuclease UvrABC nuclease subunit
VHTAPAASSGVDGTTSLYRLYDSAGRLLYVGISHDVHSRIRTHRTDKHWGAEVADARLEVYPTRASALSAEANAIRRERPRYNVIHNR